MFQIVVYYEKLCVAAEATFKAGNFLIAWSISSNLKTQFSYKKYTWYKKYHVKAILCCQTINDYYKKCLCVSHYLEK